MLTEWPFVIRAAAIDESVLPGEGAEDYVRRTSLGKAQSSVQLAEKTIDERFVLSCDTAVVDGDTILGKPSSAQDASAMLRHLRGRVHQVYSALTIFDRQDGRPYQELCVTDVPMRDYNEIEMMTYIASGDPMDKAGAYAIQNEVFHPVDDFFGCYANVMGLPLCHLSRLMTNLDNKAPLDIPAVCQQHLGYMCPIYQKVLIGEM